MNQILAHLTVYSFLGEKSEKPYGIRIWSDTIEAVMAGNPDLEIQTFWFATYQERNAVANTLTALGIMGCKVTV